MNINFRRIIICLVLLSVSAISSSARSSNSSNCTRTCGDKSVQYPFGFSDGCGIRLDCESRNMEIGGFTVQNVTSDQILVSVPEECKRPIHQLSVLFGSNFAPTWRNGFLLENCSSRFNDCVIPGPGKLNRSRFGFGACDSIGGNNDPYNISCYSGVFENATDFLDFGKVMRAGNCGYLLSSVMLDMAGNASSLNETSSISLKLQTVELGWWMDGNCSCHPNANCMPVIREDRKQSHRCKCFEGYIGDGFAGGDGCAKVSACHRPGCDGSKVGILIGGVIAGASSMAALAFICYCLKKRSTTLKSRLSAKRLLSEAAGSSTVPLYHYKEIERATNAFSEKQRLGTGAYGTVYAGKLHSNEWVAIKKIRYRDHDSVEQVMNEIKLLSSVSHPNLVRLLGCCIENSEQILVYEYMPNGTLSQHLQRERGSVLPWTTRLTIATETAHAIAHLHSAMNPPIFHRDIKSSNILLDFNFNSKVADFGLSRFGMTDDSHISTAPQGTPGYVDPQYYQNFHLSDKSDVYSFGVVLMEIITAMKVVDFSRPHSEINLAALAIERIGKGRVDEIIDPFLEPNRDAWTLSSIHKVSELAFRCLAFHRDMRPSMMEVAEELEQIRLSGWRHLKRL